MHKFTPMDFEMMVEWINQKLKRDGGAGPIISDNYCLT